MAIALVDLLDDLEEGVAHVGHVLGQVLAAVPGVFLRLPAHDVVLQLGRAVHDGLFDGVGDGLHVLPDILLGGPLEGDLGGDDAHEDAHLVLLGVDLVGGPLHTLVCYSRGNIRAWLEQEGDAVRKTVDRDALFCAGATNGYPALHHKRVAIVGRSLGHGVGGHEHGINLHFFIR